MKKWLFKRLYRGEETILAEWEVGIAQYLPRIGEYIYLNLSEDKKYEILNIIHSEQMTVVTFIVTLV